MELRELDRVFKYIANRAGKKRRVVVIDEFSYLVEKDAAIPSIFQLCWDEVLKDTHIMLILCGSSISMMEKGALSYESPLYGRRTGQWKVLPMGFGETLKFFPDKTMEETIEIYSVTGGIPEYLLKIQPELDLRQNILDNMFRKGEFLYEETDFLLQEELRDPSTYKSVLAAMAGSTKVTDIANKAGLKAGDLPKYLNVLQSLELVGREVPVTEKKTKKSSYTIKDNFFRFWFRIAFPYRSELEEGRGDEVLKRQEPELTKHIAHVFEDVCREALIRMEAGNYEKFGRWWGSYREGDERKTGEIDMAALNEKAKGILFGECKYEKNVDARAILHALRYKAEQVQWKRKTERFVIFAKSFSSKVEEEGVSLYDLKAVEAIFRSKPAGRKARPAAAFRRDVKA
jgi:AAA+ ATPase superfamily predicted ATPase